MGFLILLLVPVLLGILAWRFVDTTIEASNHVARTNELMTETERLLSAVKDVEVAQREFILTGDQQFTDLIRASRTKIQASLNRVAAAGGEGRWVELLRVAIPQKFEEIEKTIELRTAGDFTAASNVILQNRGTQAMDDIRRIAQNMALDEGRNLDRRSEEQRRSFSQLVVVFVAVLLLSIAMISVLHHYVRREARRARELNQELERRVALRTEQLQRSNEDLQQFAYVASHDMKEPMRMIASYAALLQRRYQTQLGDDADTWIGFIVDGVRRMELLINDLLQYSKASNGQNEQTSEVDAESVLGIVLNNLRVTIADAGATVTHDPLPKVMYDQMRLTQLIQNLVSNAIKYRVPGRKPVVHVSAMLTDCSTVFSVRDNGPGIPQEHQEAIFGIFKRLHGKEVEGTGIGLAMCRKIVERHGGKIWVESTEGAGSTFRFTVPHAQTVKAHRAG